MAICILHKKEFHETDVLCSECFSNIEILDKEEFKKNSEKIKLKDELVRLYNEKKPYQILYLSDLSNNLSKVHKGMNESVIFDNPGCTITLIYPNEMSLLLLQGTYSHVYIDGDIKDRDNILTYLKLQDGAQVTIVEPIKQQLVR